MVVAAPNTAVTAPVVSAPAATSGGGFFSGLGSLITSSVSGVRDILLTNLQLDQLSKIQGQQATNNAAVQTALPAGQIASNTGTGIGGFSSNQLLIGGGVILGVLILVLVIVSGRRKR